MGMTLDEAISNLEQIKTGFDYCYGTNKMVNVVVYGDDIQTFDFVIDTMRKYQKIEEAYKKYLNDVVTNIYADKKFVEALEGIFKNGNDD